ncbi:MAG: helix-turn-helix domain-containing protein [Fibromonadaceae bacterium]|jgi:transcriptional regulator with XRE-family HTH domain|nr:helix-turn-helix domain-containing protein [Fibromonadaceae bacterium]
MAYPAKGKMENYCHLRKSIEQALRFVLPCQRSIKKMSQHEFSKKCGFSRQYISLVESGKRIPKLEFILCFASGFDMSLQDFTHLLVERVIFYEDLEKRKQREAPFKYG